MKMECLEEQSDGTKSQPANKNGKKADSGSSSSFFTWFIVLALLGVWTSVAMVYFDVVDYQGVIGKLVAYDTDGDGDFDLEDAKTLLDEKPGDAARSGAKKESSPKKDVGLKLQKALKQQLAIIQERVEAKKLAKLALAEARQLLAKEEEEKELKLGRKKITARMKERLITRLQKEEEKMEKEEREKALQKLRKETAKQPNKKRDEESKDSKEARMKLKKGGRKKTQPENKLEGHRKKAQEASKGTRRQLAKDKRNTSKAAKSVRREKK